MTHYRHFSLPNHSHLSHITVAGNIRDEVFYAGMSFCSKRDQFSRPIGRTLAEYRLKEDPLEVTKETVEKYLLKYYLPIFKKEVLHTIIEQTPLESFNINVLFEALIYKFSKED